MTAGFKSDDVVATIAAQLQPVAAAAARCTACRLAATRSTVVFGSGSARSGIVIIGEAPGANEDAAGLPFVGRSGQMLDRLLASAGIARADVYICNVLKCRPPDNRDPKTDEAAACAPFLRQQLELLQPRILCALGLHAARWLIPGKQPMSALRGQLHDFVGIPTLVTYHPAALLRNPRLVAAGEADFAKLSDAAATPVHRN